MTIEKSEALKEKLNLAFSTENEMAETLSRKLRLMVLSLRIAMTIEQTLIVLGDKKYSPIHDLVEELLKDTYS